MDEQLRYPIGHFEAPEVYSKEYLDKAAQVIHILPEKLFTLVGRLDDGALNLTYRPDGWNIRQLIHHIADSHINAFTRFKRVLTEETPNVNGYFEEKWAELSDSLTMKIRPSLMIIQGIHSRWYTLMENLSEEELEQQYYHQTYEKYVPLKEVIGLYAWHSEHHLAHIQLALQQAKIDSNNN